MIEDEQALILDYIIEKLSNFESKKYSKKRVAKKM